MAARPARWPWVSRSPAIRFQEAPAVLCEARARGTSSSDRMLRHERWSGLAGRTRARRRSNALMCVDGVLLVELRRCRGLLTRRGVLQARRPRS